MIADSSPGAPRAKRGNVGWGLALIALCLGTATLIHRHPERLDAPAWVAYVAVSTFGIAGLLLLATVAARPRVEGWLAVGLVLAMAVPGGWIAFGAGERRCTSNLPFLPLPQAAVCRTAFGIGTLIVVIVFAAFVRRAAAPRVPR